MIFLDRSLCVKRTNELKLFMFYLPTTNTTEATTTASTTTASTTTVLSTRPTTSISTTVPTTNISATTLPSLTSSGIQGGFLLYGLSS